MLNTTPLTDTTVITDLITELIEASKTYYLDGGNSPLTDEEFDAKQNYLRTAQSAHPDLFKPGTDGFNVLEGTVLLGAEMNPSDGSTDVQHKSPMLSLDKAKTETDLNKHLVKVQKAGAKDFRLQAKLDGVAISALYNQGTLERVATRGTGTLGQDVTYIINTPNLTVLGIPTTITNQEEIEVRGELFFTHKQYSTVNNTKIERKETPFELSRSAVSGIVKLSKANMPYPAELTFAAYSTIVNGQPAELSNIANEGTFTSVDQITEQEAKTVKLTGFQNFQEIHESIEKFGQIMNSFTVPTDGIVIKPTNEPEMLTLMGNTHHHPASQIAWKYPAEQAQTIIDKIIVTVGKTGRLTPVAELIPVKLDGSVIARASLHNFSLVAEKDIREGSVIIIEKANEIIPQIVAVISRPANSVPVTIPDTCPSCNEPAQSEDGTNKTINCNNTECPSRQLQSLLFAVGRTNLDIDRLSTATLTYLFEAGLVTDLAALYEIDINTLAEATTGTNKNGTTSRVGIKTATHIMQHIEKSKTLPLERILPALAITNIGHRASKAITKQFKTIEEILEATTESFLTLDKFGHSRATNAYTGIQARRGIIERMQTAGVTFGNNPQGNTTPTDTGIDLTGLSFAISGTVPEPFENRTKLVEYIENNNGEFHSAPKKTTTHMIGNPTDTSSKIKKAQSLGINILEPAQFTEKYTK